MSAPVLPTNEVCAPTMVPVTVLHGVALFLMCVMTFGGYFVYDVPGSVGYGVMCTHSDDPYCIPLSEIDDPSHHRTQYTAKGCDKLGKDGCADLWYCNYDDSSKKCVAVARPHLSIEDCVSACWDGLTALPPDHTLSHSALPPRSSGVRRNRTELHPFTAPTAIGMLNGTECFCRTAADNTAFSSNTRTLPLSQCRSPESSRCHGKYCGSATAVAVYNTSCPIQTIQMYFGTAHKEYSSAMNLALYSAYSYPNVILCLFGGLIIDKVGLRTATVVFALCIAVGHFAFTLATAHANWPLQLVGRFIFGLGGESVAVAQSAYTARWFANTRWLALAFGVTLSFTRIGSAVAFSITPPISHEWGVMAALWVGVGLCICTLVIVLTLAKVDMVGESRRLVDEAIVNDEASTLQICNLPRALWLLGMICGLFYVSVFDFNTIGTNLFSTKYDLSLSTAAIYVAVYSYVAAVASPVVGILVDRFGWALFWMFGAAVGVVLTYFLLIFTDIFPPWALMSILGLALTAMSATLWSAVPQVVGDPRLLGTAYGMMTASQNVGLATVPLIIGAIRDSRIPLFSGGVLERYYYCAALLGCLAALAGLLVIALYIYDKRYLSSILQAPQSGMAAETDKLLVASIGRFAASTGDLDAAEFDLSKIQPLGQSYSNLAAVFGAQIRGASFHGRRMRPMTSLGADLDSAAALAFLHSTGSGRASTYGAVGGSWDDLQKAATSFRQRTSSGF